MFDCTEYRKKNYFLINQLSFFSLYSNKTSIMVFVIVDKSALASYRISTTRNM